MGRKGCRDAVFGLSQETSQTCRAHGTGHSSHEALHLEDDDGMAGWDGRSSPKATTESALQRCTQGVVLRSFKDRDWFRARARVRVESRSG